MPKKAELIKNGTVFNYLTIVKELPRKIVGSRHIRMFYCRCKCKNFIEVKLDSIRSGHTKSCGCLVSETNVKRNTKHNLYYTPLYRIHQSMKNRCNNKNNSSYKDYGARGIEVCKEWSGVKGFINFYNWNKNLPKAKQWKKGLEIDRRNNDKGYTPNNCRWVTSIKNKNNTRKTHYVFYKDKKYTFSELYKKYKVEGVNYKLALARYKLGWDVIKSITQSCNYVA